MIRAFLRSAMRVPEYTPLSSQMDSILSADFITFESPSQLQRGEMIKNYNDGCWIYVSPNETNERNDGQETLKGREQQKETLHQWSTYYKALT